TRAYLGLHRYRRARRSKAIDRWPVVESAWARGRLLPRRYPLRPRPARHEDVQGGDLRTGTELRTGQGPRRGGTPDQRSRARQRRRLLHTRRRRGTRIREAHRGGHGGDQCPHPRADGVAWFRRLEEQPVWRHARLRRGRSAFLYAPEVDHAALAQDRGQGRRIRDADGALRIPARSLRSVRWVSA